MKKQAKETLLSIGGVEIVNLTPHVVSILQLIDGSADEYETKKVFEVGGPMARATTKTTLVGTLNGISLVKTEYGAPEGFPEPREGVFLIVSMLAAKAALSHGRGIEDLVLVDKLIRDKGGNPIGCLNLQLATMASL